jgi:streptogramin lyase
VQNTTPGSTGCTTTNSGTQCTISVNASVGTDSFLVKTYDQPNAAGNVLSSGTVQGTVVSGHANSFPLTLDGAVASIALIPADAYPKVAGSTTITAQAKDAGGNTIIGTYDAPIALTTSGNATFDSTALKASDSVATVTLADSQTAAFTVTGSADGKTGSVTLNPSSGVAYYNIGSGADDVTGLHLITGSDGKLYYTTAGLLQCSGGPCFGSSGTFGQFDPNTHADTEIDLPQYEPLGMYQTADGAVWVALSQATSAQISHGFVGHLSGAFSQANLNVIPLPTASPDPAISRPRSFALGADGNLYLTANTDRNIYKIPVSSPSTANITAVPLQSYASPTGAVFSGRATAEAQGITAGQDGKLYIANFAFVAPNVLQYDTANATFTPFAPPGGQGPEPRYIVAGSDGNLYESFGGVCVTMPCNGGLNAMTTAGAFTPIAMPDGYSEPDDLSAGNGFVAFVDLGQAGFGTYDLASKEVRDYPIEPINANDVLCCSTWLAPDGVTVGADGSIWYITYGTVSKGGPLAIAHVLMTANWSVWPAQKFDLYGTGDANAQLVGVMENGDSGPFTLGSSDKTVATLEPIAGESHNFHLVGVGAGTCAVTITDKNGRTESISVNVTSTTGTVQSRGRRAPGSQQGRI